MPSQAFLKLPKDRQDVLIHAAIEEFSRALLPQASINKIIQAIGMPRGSFYLYFKNKEDLYFYVLQNYQYQMLEEIRTCLLENEGDMMRSFLQIFDRVTAYCLRDEHKNFFRNVFLNMDFKAENQLFVEPDEEHKKMKHEIMELLDVSKLNANTNEEVRNILRIMMTITIHTMVGVFMGPWTFEVLRAKYIDQLELLKNGLYKKGRLDD